MDAEKATENVFEFTRMKDDFIDNIVDILDASNHKSEYINECKTELLKLKREKFQKTIAIIGRTGSGKSSLLNALLNQENFLPISQASACTAVPVEISANFENTNYEAEVEFLTLADWETELKLRKRCNDDFEIERLPYNSTLVSSYEPVSAAEAEDFIEKISRYMSAVPKELSHDDDDDDDELYDVNDCDFVRCVKIRIPNSDICSSGITLVDLPGKGDTHAVRNRIASEYINKCNAIWIVSPIGRAISDDIQTSIDDEFLQKLLMESRYGTLSFICTKTDEIDVNNYIQERKLQKDPDIVRLKLALKDVEKTISENEKRRRQLNKDPIINASELEECRKVNLVSVGQKYEYDKEMKEICINSRNDYSRMHLERILKSKLSKLVPDKQLTASQIPNVFCVSAKDYKELKERDEESSDDRTGISGLANHEKTTINLRINQFREGIVHRLTERILMIVNSLSDTVNVEPDVQITAKKLFLAQKNLLQKSIEDFQNENMKEIREKYQSLTAAVDRGIQKSVANAITIVGSWEINYKYNTYQATVRRYGEYCSRGKVGKVDFNYQLCESFNDSILHAWLILFDVPVEMIYQQILTAVNDFHSQLLKELSIAPFSMYIMKLPNCTAFQIKSDIDYIETYTKLEKQHIHAVIKHKIIEHMEAAYELCQNVDTGKNRFEKMNSVVKDHVHAISKELFDSVGSAVRKEIESWITSVEDMLHACNKRLLNDIASTHEPIFEKIDSESDKISIGRCLLKFVRKLKLLYPSSLNSDDKKLYLEKLYLELIEKCELLSQPSVKIENTATSSGIQEANSTNLLVGNVLVCNVKVEDSNVSDDKLEEIVINSKEQSDAEAVNRDPTYQDDTDDLKCNTSAKKLRLNIRSELQSNMPPMSSASNVTSDQSGSNTGSKTIPANTPGKVPPANIPGKLLLANTLGKLPQPNTPGTVPQVITPGKRPQGDTPGKGPQANTSGEEPKVNISGKVSQVHTSKKVSQANTPGKVSPSNTPKNVPLSNTPGKVPPANTPEKMAQCNTPGKIPLANTPGKVPQANTLGKLFHSNTPRKMPQANTSVTEPQVDTSGKVSQVHTSRKVSQANTPGKVSHSNTPKNVPQSNTPGKAPPANTSEKVAQCNTPKKPLANTSGNVPQANIPGKVTRPNVSKTQILAVNLQSVKSSSAMALSTSQMKLNSSSESLQSGIPTVNHQATASVLGVHYDTSKIITASHTPSKPAVQSIKSITTAANVQSNIIEHYFSPKSSTENVQRNTPDKSIEPRTPVEKLTFSSAIINSHTSTPEKAKVLSNTPVLNPLGNLSVAIPTPSTSADIKQETSPLPTKRRRISAPITIVIDDDD